MFANSESEKDDLDASLDVSEAGFHGLAPKHLNSIGILEATSQENSLHPNEIDSGQIQTKTSERQDSEDLEASTVIGPNRERLPTSNWSTFTDAEGFSTTDDSGEGVYQGIDLNYIMSVGSSAGPHSRHRSHSFVAPQSLPLPPPKDKSQPKDNNRKKEKTKGKEALNIAAMQGLVGLPSIMSNQQEFMPWFEVDDEMTGTVARDDSFAEGLRRLEFDFAALRNEWSFVRVSERVLLPPRHHEGSPRMWDVWRCAQIGKIRLERATLPHCTFSPFLLLFLGMLITYVFFCS